MLVYKSDKNYCVYLNEDGDDLWITVTNGYCNGYDCLVGSVSDPLDTRLCLETAYSCFYPAQYVMDNLEPNDERVRVLTLAKDAYEIDRALDMALVA